MSSEASTSSSSKVKRRIDNPEIDINKKVKIEQEEVEESQYYGSSNAHLLPKVEIEESVMPHLELEKEETEYDEPKKSEVAHQSENCENLDLVLTISSTIDAINLKTTSMMKMLRSVMDEQPITRECPEYVNHTPAKALIQAKREIGALLYGTKVIMGQLSSIMKAKNLKVDESDRHDLIEKIIISFIKPIYRVEEFREAVDLEKEKVTQEELIAAFDRLSKYKALIVCSRDKLFDNWLIIRETRIKIFLNGFYERVAQLHNYFLFMDINFRKFDELIDSMTDKERLSVIKSHPELLGNIFKLAVLKNPGAKFKLFNYSEELSVVIKTAMEQLMREGLIKKIEPDFYVKTTNDNHLNFRLSQYGIRLNVYLEIARQPSTITEKRY